MMFCVVIMWLFWGFFVLLVGVLDGLRSAYVLLLACVLFMLDVC